MVKLFGLGNTEFSLIHVISVFSHNTSLGNVPDNFELSVLNALLILINSDLNSVGHIDAGIPDNAVFL